MDFTLSPRLARSYTIFEAEARHLMKNGSYEVNGSYGDPSYNKGDKSSRNGRYHIPSTSRKLEQIEENRDKIKSYLHILHG